jgi:hypothetical protein
MLDGDWSSDVCSSDLIVEKSRDFIGICPAYGVHAAYLERQEHQGSYADYDKQTYPEIQ